MGWDRVQSSGIERGVLELSGGKCGEMGVGNDPYWS